MKEMWSKRKICNYLKITNIYKNEELLIIWTKKINREIFGVKHGNYFKTCIYKFN